MKAFAGFVVGVAVAFITVCVLSVAAPNVFTSIAGWFGK